MNRQAGLGGSEVPEAKAVAVIQPYIEPQKVRSDIAPRVAAGPPDGSRPGPPILPGCELPPPAPPQEWTPQRLDGRAMAQGMTLSGDGLSVSSHKGYRTVRAAHG